MRLRRCCGAGLIGLAACAPALDWREVRPDDGGLTLLFPCKPARHARQMQLAGATVRLTLHACSAGGATWALALADVTEPGRVALALAELRTAAAKNLGADAGTPVEWRIDGATPNPQAGRSEFAGQLPDGKFVREQVAVFAKGTRIYQATVLGEQLEGDSLDTFFTGLRIGS